MSSEKLVFEGIEEGGRKKVIIKYNSADLVYDIVKRNVKTKNEVSLLTYDVKGDPIVDYNIGEIYATDPNLVENLKLGKLRADKFVRINLPTKSEEEKEELEKINSEIHFEVRMLESAKYNLAMTMKAFRDAGRIIKDLRAKKLPEKELELATLEFRVSKVFPKTLERQQNRVKDQREILKDLKKKRKEKFGVKTAKTDSSFMPIPETLVEYLEELKEVKTPKEKEVLNDLMKEEPMKWREPVKFSTIEYPAEESTAVMGVAQEIAKEVKKGSKITPKLEKLIKKALDRALQLKAENRALREEIRKLKGEGPKPKRVKKVRVETKAEEAKAIRMPKPKKATIKTDPLKVTLKRIEKEAEDAVATVGASPEKAKRVKMQITPRLEKLIAKALKKAQKLKEENKTLKKQLKESKSKRIVRNKKDLSPRKKS